MNFKPETIRLYCGGSPFVGIPVDGATAVFRRDHIRAALATGPTRIIYNHDTKILTFRNNRSEWRLNDLLGQQKFSSYQIHEQLYSWAKGKRSGARKRQETAQLGADGVRVRKLLEAVRKLEKQRDRIYLHQPQNPLVYHSNSNDNNYIRDSAKRWADEKRVRKQLAKLTGHKLFHGEPKTWADFYRQIEAITGRRVSDQQKFTRVHACKRYRHGLPDYPDREDYLKNFPRYLVMSERPWGSEPFDMKQALIYHAQARLEYVAALREKMALDSQIGQHRAEIADASKNS
jgi:hypothetical protein